MELPFSDQPPLFRVVTFSEQNFYQATLLENRQFFRAGTFGNTDLFGGETFQSKSIFRRGTFSNQVLLRNINFFRRVCLCKKLILRKGNIPHCLLFLNSYFFRVATFLKKLALNSKYFFRRLPFHNMLFQKRYYTKVWEFFLVHLLLLKSRITNKVYLISGLHKVLWNYYFLSKPLFKGPYLLNAAMLFRKQLPFQNMQFFRTASFQQLTSFSQLHFLLIIQQLALLILEFLDHQIPGDLHIGFTHSKRQKVQVLGEFNKNISFSTKFQC